MVSFGVGMSKNLNMLFMVQSMSEPITTRL